MIFKWLLECTLGLTIGGAALFFVVFVRRWRVSPAFWIALGFMVLGFTITSWVLFFALLHAPSVPFTAAGSAYLVGQLLKAAGTLALCFVVSKYPNSAGHESGKEEK